jgi:IS5 family transposase
LPLVEQGSEQARRRVLLGEAVPAKEKLLSLFETHTQVITRHKAGKKVEFGRKVWLEETEGGIVTGYVVLEEGGGTDQPYLEAALDRHQERFGHPPSLLAGDRGVSSPENEQLAKQRGVKRVVLPASGKVSAARRAQERERWFRRGFNFRAGMEGRIHVLKRDFGLARCRYRGEAGMERWVGWGVLTHNLRQIARQQGAREASTG